MNQIKSCKNIEINTLNINIDKSSNAKQRPVSGLSHIGGKSVVVTNSANNTYGDNSFNLNFNL